MALRLKAHLRESRVAMAACHEYSGSRWRKKAELEVNSRAHTYSKQNGFQLDYVAI